MRILSIKVTDYVPLEECIDSRPGAGPTGLVYSLIDM